MANPTKARFDNLRGPLLDHSSIDKTRILDCLRLVIVLLVGESGLKNVRPGSTARARGIDKVVNVAHSVRVVEPRDQPGAISKANLDVGAGSGIVDRDGASSGCGRGSGRRVGSGRRWGRGRDRRFTGSDGSKSISTATKRNKLLFGRDIVFVETFEDINVGRLAGLDVHQAEGRTTVLDGEQDLAVRRVVVAHQWAILYTETITPKGQGAGDALTRNGGG